MPGPSTQPLAGLEMFAILSADKKLIEDRDVFSVRPERVNGPPGMVFTLSVGPILYSHCFHGS
jgi:hypothetical protein